jgi:hypothetical protein
MRAIGILVAFAFAVAAFPGQAQLANAYTGRTIGCTSWGYTITIPDDWTVIYMCTGHNTAYSVDRTMTLTVAIERHGFWSDDRSRSSISADEQQGAHILGTIRWDSPTIGGHRYLRGTATARAKDGSLGTALEMETFDRGSMFKFRLDIAHRNAKTDNSAVVEARAILNTATITGPVTGYAPVAAPSTKSTPAPGGDQGIITVNGVQWATSPDAPGVAVSATNPTIQSNEQYPPQDGYVDVVTRVTVLNGGHDNYDVNPLDFSLVTGDFISHSAELMDMNITNTELQATNLPPGQPISGDIAFQIPTGQTKAALFWEPAFGSPRVHVPTH